MRRDDLRSTAGTNLAARVRAFSERLRAIDGGAAPTIPPPSAEALEALHLRREGLLVTDEAIDGAARTRPAGPVEGGRARGLFELADDARLVTDERAVVLDANAAAADMLGADAAQLRGWSLAAFVERADLGRFRLGLASLARDGSLEIDLRIVGRGGVPVMTSLSVGREGDRFAWSAQATAPESGIRAVTGFPRALVAERIEALQQALEERDRALEDSERRCAALMAQQQQRELALALIAHELRGPMSAILGWSRILRHPRVEREQRERAVRVIEHNAQHQRTLVDALTDASRLAADKLEVEQEALDLVPLVGLAVDGARPDASASDISLTLLARGECVVLGDALRLSQVVTNLLANALKFTPPGGAVAVRVTAGGGVATLRVADTGVGIAPAQMPLVFERFHQGAGSRDAAGGLGLGLYLVREIVALHGGHVAGASPGEGLGATFTVTLPLAR